MFKQPTDEEIYSAVHNCSLVEAASECSELTAADYFFNGMSREYFQKAWDFPVAKTQEFLPTITSDGTDTHSLQINGDFISRHDHEMHISSLNQEIAELKQLLWDKASTAYPKEGLTSKEYEDVRAAMYRLSQPAEAVASTHLTGLLGLIPDETSMNFVEIGIGNGCDHDPSDTGMGFAYCKKCDAKMRFRNSEWQVE